METFFTQTLIPWLTTIGYRIGIIILVVLIFNTFGGALIERAVRKTVKRHGGMSATAEKKREDTLIAIFNTTINVIVWSVALMMILSEIGVDVAPLLAGAGLVGVAVGFGAQYLVRDVISGLFIILENQYRVGDTVTLLNTTGTVEDITLRKTVIRDLDGGVHHIPNGEVKMASNLSKDFARVNIDIGVAYESDLAVVERVINETGEALANDPAWKEIITSPPKFLRVNSFGDSAVDIKILGEVVPQEQWAVAGEFRKRLKIAFDKEGIEIPYPHRVVKQIT